MPNNKLGQYNVAHRPEYEIQAKDNRPQKHNQLVKVSRASCPISECRLSTFAHQMCPWLSVKFPLFILCYL